MREIKFRGKDKYTGEWVYGYLMNMHSPDRLFIGNWHNIGGEATVKDELFSGYKEIDPLTVGFYTSLKDRQGKEIYEGDILKLIANDADIIQEWNGVVEFGNPNGSYDWGWQLKPLNNAKVNPDILLWVETEMPNVSCEIIGNIYENQDGNSKTVTMPKWLFERHCEDSKLVAYLSKVRGYGWIKTVREEMELEEKYQPASPKGR